MNAHELNAMRRAIAISAQGLGSTSPNPPVGCVILDRNGRTVGEGYHVRKGDSHAEVNALKAAGGNAAGGTAVVTLEPCNHYGRTPPCREALITANVTRVLIAVMDPTSRGEGGASLLEKAGIEVVQDYLKEEALLVLGPWLTSLSSDRTSLTWIYEAGPDGTPITSNAHSVIFDEVRILRESHDLVIRQSGEIEEGRPGSHGRDVFQVPHDRLIGGTTDFVEALSETGARTALIEGAPPEFSTMDITGAADRVIAYLPLTSQSRNPDAIGDPTQALPPGYRLTEVIRHKEYVRLVGYLTT